MDGMATFEPQMRAYLDFARTEKNLSANTLEAYRRDLSRFGTFLGRRDISSVTLRDLRAYVDQLRSGGLSHRSIARHVTTIRGLFQFLTDELPLTSNPAELLGSPAIGRSLPKYLSERGVED